MRLPAGSLKGGETFTQAMVRSGKEKLGVQLHVGKLINEGEIEREHYVLHMKEFEATIGSGELSVPQQIKGITQYTDWKWGTADDLQEAAQKGSLCCKLYLNSL